ncbi:hypothetical protein [Desulfospira joergensenii]|uniref:hypothetical protein n=1 Tax=Desulfospira joergensenii TaxID=53329 RepID=UPI0003B56B58|nr:hypothetical protein [Desulfospira joergensenii]
MKVWNKSWVVSIMAVSLASVFILSAHAGELVMGGDSPRVSVTAEAVKTAVTRLGHKVTEFKDAKGNPHFVFDKTVENVKDIAVFMADCGDAGCSDVVLYADFGVVKKIKPEQLNNWNHISNMQRSKAFRSGNVDGEGPVGLSLAISFLGDSELDQDRLAMQIGLFLVEVGIFSSEIDHL